MKQLYNRKKYLMLYWYYIMTIKMDFFQTQIKWDQRNIILEFYEIEIILLLHLLVSMPKIFYLKKKVKKKTRVLDKKNNRERNLRKKRWEYCS